ARRIVTLLPKNRPTPIAPPMAIMVSCLWPRRRCRPSTSGMGVDTCSTGVVPATETLRSVIRANSGGFTDQKIDVFPENFHNCLHIVHCVVYMERYPKPVVAIGCHDAALCELLHQ